LRILIVVPRQPHATGNHVTAARYQRGLLHLGHRVQIEETSPEEHLSAGDFQPDIVHLLHAYRTGRPYLASGSATPFVVGLTGTDLHQGLAHAEQAPLILQVLNQASAVITQNPLTFRDLPRQLPLLRQKLRYITPGVELGQDPYTLRETLNLTAGLLFLHPAGIRPVKENLELLQLFDRLTPTEGWRIAFCGPLLDEGYGRRFLAAVAERPWSHYLGTIAPTAMAAVLHQADIILNHSSCEGLPNALLEAAVLGRPMLARHIEGNAAVVEDGCNGLLYDDDAGFLRQASLLLNDPALRRQLARPTPERYDPVREAQTLEAIYREALGR
jgi:glycosyltransferase involved in cell wall biosynthesis